MENIRILLSANSSIKVKILPITLLKEKVEIREAGIIRSKLHRAPLESNPETYQFKKEMI